MLNAAKKWWNCTVKLGSEQRWLLYQVMAAQTGAGVAVGPAFAAIAGKIRVSPQIAAVAGSAAAADMEGRGSVEGLRESLAVPDQDLGVLSVAEAEGMLSEAFEDLCEAEGEKLSISRQVLAPNAYYLVMCGVFLFFGYQATDVLDGFTDWPAATETAAYRLSALLQWLPALGIAAATVAAAGVYGRANWTGRARRLLWVFETDYRLRLGVRVAEFAGRLYRHGASHEDFLGAAAVAFRGGAYEREVVREAERAHVVDGEPIERALSGRLLSPKWASVLEGLAPTRARYPQAYEAIARIQRNLLIVYYRRAARMVQVIALTLAAALIVTLIQSLFEIFAAGNMTGR